MWAYIIVIVIVVVTIYAVISCRKAMSKPYNPTAIDNYYAKKNAPYVKAIDDADHVLTTLEKRPAKKVIIGRRYIKK